ncbi:hypothetical protein BWX39_08405 [Prevotella intermedia ATCC 25611 = DSM 20706]|nr:hypothetical protein BWX39_08405 [Prevotella intermedia ATCC 25611 = DSM 20706]SUB95658.1 Uncharacterised protein [Prevotella intermedia]
MYFLFKQLIISVMQNLCFCIVKAAVLHGKSVGFASQKSRFRKTKLQLPLFDRKYIYKDEENFLTLTFGNQ